MFTGSRRNFLKSGLFASAAFTIPPISFTESRTRSSFVPGPAAERYQTSKGLDLAPAKWIWFPSKRCLPNTVVLFRKEIELSQVPAKATGWILGESRYRLYVNGKRIQFGPAPADPRWPEADPVDLAPYLVKGKNVIGAEVLYFGHGDGTWPIGKPGFIFKLNADIPGGEGMELTSDRSWQTRVARSWKPGQYKRWYLRAFQEEFDANLYPAGWNTVSFQADSSWLRPMILEGPSDKPVINTNYRDYLYDSQGQPGFSELRPRSISLSKETMVPVKKLVQAEWLKWNLLPEEYFEFITPDPFEIIDGPAINSGGNDSWDSVFISDKALVLTFELQEQVVGFPYFTITAPKGTVVELLVHEAHVPGTDAIMNTHFHSWTRFVCAEGENRFETFDYESLRWLQLHIRNTRGKVKVSSVGVRRRMFDWKNRPVVNCNDPSIQKVIDASVNTLYNCAIETIVDGMGRERQQYSGDVGHVLHSVFMTMGEPTIAARFINTWSQGMTSQGFFLDCWPAFDRLARLMEREMQLTEWGPLLDHGIGFNFDCYHYYLYSGEAESIREAFPRLVTFFRYLQKLKCDDGLLPVENIGVPVVWIDHNAYKKQRHKQCAFNLYAAAMMETSFSALCEVYGERDLAEEARKEGKGLRESTVKRYWSEKSHTFINNLPWAAEEKEERLCDRSLATALLFDQFPRGEYKPSMEILVKSPSNLGLSYPANANWRYWALSKVGRADIFINELRNIWSKMDSVQLNNTLAEDWDAKPDSNSQWSHCPISPLFGMHMCVAGIKPLKPGFELVEITPQLHDLTSLKLDTFTPKGALSLALTKSAKKIKGEVMLPQGITGTLLFNGKKHELKAGRNKVNL